MSNKHRAGAGNNSAKKAKCGWEQCPEHEGPLESYPNKDKEALTAKYGEDLGWSPPFSYESIYGVNHPGPNSKRAGSNTNMNYPTQQHHVIPVSAFKKSIQKLKNNLILLGWNLNNEVFNGIVLPEYPVDMFWHDLQCHAGLPDSCHGAYTKDIVKKLDSIETDSLDLCKEDEQDLLIQMMYEFVTEIRNDIINWNIIIYPSVSTNLARVHAFKHADFLPPPSKPSNRKLNL